MEYEQYTLEELQKMFVQEQNPEELNKIMSAISDKHEILSDDTEETNNVQLEEEICLLYTSPSPRDGLLSRMPSSA